MKLDYLNKEEVRTFVYRNTDYTEYTQPIEINGRKYLKTGKVCALSFFGILYKVQDLDTNHHYYVMTIGMSKQHPEDDYNKHVAIEVARENATISPIIVINDIPASDKKYDNIHDMFVNICKSYAYLKSPYMDFVMTKQEKELHDIKKFENDWGFYLHKNNTHVV